MRASVCFPPSLVTSAPPPGLPTLWERLKTPPNQPPIQYPLPQASPTLSVALIPPPGALEFEVDHHIETTTGDHLRETFLAATATLLCSSETMEENLKLIILTSDTLFQRIEVILNPLRLLALQLSGLYCLVLTD